MAASFAAFTAGLQQTYVIHRPARLHTGAPHAILLQLLPSSMDAVKAEINSLMQQRSAIEAEIKQRTDRLDEPGMPGMKGSLLDKEVRAVLM